MPADPQAFVDRFTSAQVAAAARISPDTLKNWVSRRPAVVILNQYDEAGGGKGSRNLFSLNRVMQVAIMADLVRLGWGPNDAAVAAIRFTDIGGVAAGWVGEEEIKPTRSPGALFETGETILVGRPPRAGEHAPFAQVLNVQPKDTWTTLAHLMQVCADDPAGATILNIGDIMLRVRLSLNLPAFA